MKKQKLIEKINKIAIETPFPKSKIVDYLEVIKLIEQLDEPQPVKVLQFVADWIEVCKEHLTTSLYTAMNPDFMKENNQSFDFILWIKKTSNQETFARAWLDGYEVEKEKRYFVKIKGNIKENVLVYGELLERYFFTKSLNLDNAISVSYTHL